MDSFGRYSYLMTSLVLLVGGLVAGTRFLQPDVRVLSITALVGLLGIFWVFGYRSEGYAHPDKVLKKVVGHGRPVVIHFYSNFSIGCLLRKMLFERRQRRFDGRVHFVHLNLNRAASQAVAETLESGLGQFVLFDAAGEERARTRLPSAAQLQAISEA